MNLPLWVQIIGSLAAAAGLVGGPILAYRAQSKTSRTTATDVLIKNMQDDRSADRVRHEFEMTRLAKEREEDKGDLAKVEAQAIRVERKMYLLEDYVGHLRRHISDGLPPPPPRWPEELFTHER